MELQDLLIGEFPKLKLKQKGPPPGTNNNSSNYTVNPKPEPPGPGTAMEAVAKALRNGATVRERLEPELQLEFTARPSRAGLRVAPSARSAGAAEAGSTSQGGEGVGG